jgi:hypothetical protein
LRSRYAARGRYSWQEESHIQFNRWLVQRYRRHVDEQDTLVSLAKRRAG